MTANATDTFVITGMTCANCAQRVGKALSATTGVETANVNLATERATINYDGKLVNRDALIQSVEAIGYGAILYDEAHRQQIAKEKADSLKKMKQQLIISAILTFPMILAMVLGMLGIHTSFTMLLHEPLVQFILATPVQFWIGGRFYKGAYHAIKTGAPNMDVLVALGTSAAYFFSLIFGVFLHHENALNFESSATIITLILLGKYLEQRAKTKTSSAIKQLMSLKAKSATIILENGEEVQLPIEEVQRKNVMKVKPGEQIPLDGVIIQGQAAVDESALTGESIPVEKAIGATVFGGTLNTNGQLRVQVAAESGVGVLSRIIQMVEDAQGTKAPIQKIADKVSGIFVPVVLVIALVTLVVTGFLTKDWQVAINHSVAVLVIACPCALGLATPTAIIVGTGIGAKHGVLIKGGDALEMTSQINTLVLDKTGTITMGSPEVVNFDGEKKYFSILASLENESEHPLAMAIVDEAKEKNLTLEPVRDYQTLAGLGVTGVIDNVRYYAGNKRLLKEHGISVQYEISGKTVVYLANEREFLAAVALADKVKDTSKEAIEQLQNKWIEVYMLTGDNQEAARAIGAEVGLDSAHIISNVLPTDKAEYVKKLQQTGKKVAMVGDGINDAPALANADVGIAMGTGTDIAMEAGDVTLISGDLLQVGKLIHLSHATIGKIKQNLFWSFVYNTIGIPVAALGFLNPMIAGAAMAMSSVSVIISSLMLNRKKIF
ncbi:MAG: cadmium-translocating P-type ATPase [Lactobacillales bacterium]|jgi:Cu+-exporting ATPase|nr:cadmium-translocating P-type ATPase [Lactobacillales bacterium]